MGTGLRYIYHVEACRRPARHRRLTVTIRGLFCACEQLLVLPLVQLRLVLPAQRCQVLASRVHPPLAHLLRTRADAVLRVALHRTQPLVPVSRRSAEREHLSIVVAPSMCELKLKLKLGDTSSADLDQPNSPRLRHRLRPARLRNGRKKVQG